MEKWSEIKIVDLLLLNWTDLKGISGSCRIVVLATSIYEVLENDGKA